MVISFKRRGIVKQECEKPSELGGKPLAGWRSGWMDSDPQSIPEVAKWYHPRALLGRPHPIFDTVSLHGVPLNFIA